MKIKFNKALFHRCLPIEKYAVRILRDKDARYYIAAQPLDFDPTTGGDNDLAEKMFDQEAVIATTGKRLEREFFVRIAKESYPTESEAVTGCMTGLEINEPDKSTVCGQIVRRLLEEGIAKEVN